MILQGLGGLSLLPYPFILLANVMSIAAEGPSGFERLKMAAPYILLSLYPAIWIALYAWSWRLFHHGATGWAFAISSIPVVVSAIGIRVFQRL